MKTFILDAAERAVYPRALSGVLARPVGDYL